MSDGPSITINLNSDDSGQGSGFSIEYSSGKFNAQNVHVCTTSSYNEEKFRTIQCLATLYFSRAKFKCIILNVCKLVNTSNDKVSGHMIMCVTISFPFMCTFFCLQSTLWNRI